MKLKLVTNANRTITSNEMPRKAKVKEIKEDRYTYVIKNKILIIDKNGRYFNSFSIHFIQDVDKETVSSEFMKWLKTVNKLTYKAMNDKLIEIHNYIL